MDRLFRTDAIVLKKKNYQETDQFITFFTKKFGKIVAKAKGVRKLKSRRSSSLDLFNHVSLYLYKNHGFYLLTEVKLLHSFAEIKKELSRIILAFQVMELLDKILAYEQEQTGLFGKTLGVLAIIEDGLSTEDDFIYQYKKELLNDLGFGLPHSIGADSIDIYIESILEKRLYSLGFLNDLV